MRQVRLDILGHAGIDLNEETYGDEEGMPFEMKKAAIDLLPRVSKAATILGLGSYRKTKGLVTTVKRRRAD